MRAIGPADKIRAALTPEQRAILNTIWQYEQKDGKYITALELYKRCGGKERVRSALETLGRDIVSMPPADEVLGQYSLGFPGYLLAERGEELEDLLARYLGYKRILLNENPEELEGVNVPAAMEALGFSLEQKSFFRKMFFKTPLHGHGTFEKAGLGNVNEWYPAQDLHLYVQELAFPSKAKEIVIGSDVTIHNFFSGHPGLDKALPPEIAESSEHFKKDHPDPTRVAFVMMQFGKTSAHAKILSSIKKALAKAGITAIRADDKDYHADTFSNILTYMHGCGYGIAVFERLEADTFNANVSLEVGYMFGLGKSVCLLKDETINQLPADLVGKLYKPFDPQDPMKTIPPRLSRWLKDNRLLPK